ncbi:hypothetical protein EYF80_044388 [Liparis tanakae]|uniref:Uncharacterized protein n=1 Tax=Liparis tanakae TaxID=230148 RepID=A0A4Z2FWU1_9TELE|nr:hypothetical protein EYF80_044388 [Liparis tanakae]
MCHVPTDGQQKLRQKDGIKNQQGMQCDENVGPKPAGHVPQHLSSMQQPLDRLQSKPARSTEERGSPSDRLQDGQVDRRMLTEAVWASCGEDDRAGYL